MNPGDWTKFYADNDGWKTCETNEVLGDENEMHYAVLHAFEVGKTNYYLGHSDPWRGKTILELAPHVGFTGTWVFRREGVVPVFRGKHSIKVKAEPLPLP